MATITRTSDAVREALRRSVLSAEQGPTAEQQAYAYPRHSELGLLGDPQDPTNVTFPFLRLMARDHMVAMGLHFISMPIVRAPWYYECFAADTQVLMADGGRKSIQDVREGDLVLSSAGESVGYDLVVHAGPTGFRDLVKVTLDDGRQIRCTPDHKIFGWDSWSEAGDLCRGDAVCVAGKRPDWPYVVEDPDDAWLIGLWLAEGSKGHDSYHVTCGTPGVRERLEEIAVCRGWKLTPRPKKPIEMLLGAGNRQKGDTPNNLLKAFGVRGMTTRTIEVPDRIMKADDATVAAFLSGYLAGDGCASTRQLSAHSKSERMVRDLQILASRLGARSRICRVAQGVYEDGFVWHVGDGRSLKALASVLNVTGKQHLLQRLAAWDRTTKDSSVPPEFSESLSSRHGKHGGVRVKSGAWTDLRKALYVAKADGAEDLEFKLSNGLEWRKVVSVEPDGHEEVYDLTTSANRAFFSEFGLVHNSDDARVAAFADNILRPIYGDLVLTILRFLRYGYSPAVKSFDTVNPAWTYLPGINEDPKRIWDQGNVDAIIYKPVIQLKPENATIAWKDGKFNGIKYDKRYGGIGYFVINGQKKPEIDLDHAVWSTHDKAVEDGSPFGFARIAHCAPIFHMYRYIWTLLGRAFENNADPGPVVRYPADDGSPTFDSQGNIVKNVDIALRVGRRRRSGSTLALPSTPYVDLNERALGVKKWDIEYPKSDIKFEALQNFLGQLEGLKCRALWLPEQGMVEANGSQSNRNVAAEFGDQRDESQSVLMGQIDDFIDDVFIKPAIAMNMPWYEGKLVKKTLGFGQDDEDIVRQALQLIGQADSKGTYATLGIDIRKLMESRGFPMLSHADQQKLLDQATKEAAVQSTPQVTPTQGRRALVTQTGFNRETRQAETSYIQLEDPIVLTADNDFVSGLPRTDVFSDTQVVSATRSLRNESKSFLTWAYGDFARYLGKQKSLDLDQMMLDIAAEHFAETSVELGDADRVRKAVDSIMSKWKPSAAKLTGYRDQAKSILSRVYDRTVGLQLERVSSQAKLSSADKIAAMWLEDRGAELVTGILETTRDQMAQVLADGVRAKKSTRQIAADIREQFEGIPDSRASTIARNEVQDAYNYATVATGMAANIARAQILDGTTDKVCKQRNGKIVNLADALKERRNHVNCTLCIRLLPGASLAFNVRHENLDGVLARYDADTETVLFDLNIDPELESSYLLALGGKLAGTIS